MNDCPVCGVEYDDRAGGLGADRNPTVETAGHARVCSQHRYDRHNYAYVEVYIHRSVDTGTEQ